MTSPRHFSLMLILLVAYCLVRFHALLALPVFLDEAVHIRWAQSMWTVYFIPWQAVSDGRLVNIVWIAVFWPFEGGLWLGRAATVLLGLAGLAALMRTSQMLFGQRAARAAGLLYIAAPLAFFFDRMALADGVSASLVSLSLYLCLRASRRSAHAILVLPASFAFTSLLFVKLNNVLLLFVPALALLLAKTSIRRVISIYALTAGAVIVMLAALVGRGHSDLGLDLLSARTGDASPVMGNVIGIARSLWLWLTPGIALLALIGSGLCLRHKPGWIALGLVGIPMIGLGLISQTIENRFLAPTVPGLVMLASWMPSFLSGHSQKSFRLLYIIGGLIALILPIGFIYTAYTRPGALSLPPGDEFQYLSGWPSGFGLPEAAAKLQGTIYVEEAAYIPMLSMYLPPEHTMTGVWSYQIGDKNLRLLANSPDEIAATTAPGLVVVNRSPNESGPAWQSRALRLFVFPKPGGQNQIEVWQLP